MPQTSTGADNSSGTQSGSQGGLPEYGSTTNGTGQQGGGLPEYGNDGSSSGGQQGGQQGGLPEYGNSNSSGGQQGSLPEYGSGGTGGNIAYGTADDPFGSIGSNSTVSGSGDGSQGNGGISTQARIDALDERLEQGYEVFDGMILGERERVQGAETEDSAGAGGNGNIEGGDPYGGLGLPGTAEGSGGEGGQVIARSEGANAGGGYMPNVPSRQGDFESTNQPQYPVPEDIPSGNDDDVVARQLREAAMSEPDPELREKLWDEYRAYKGL